MRKDSVETVESSEEYCPFEFLPSVPDGCYVPEGTNVNYIVPRKKSPLTVDASTEFVSRHKWKSGSSTSVTWHWTVTDTLEQCSRYLGRGGSR